jgi:hypothetical protein
MSNVILINNCPVTDSLYSIKNSLEESTICRVRKMFSMQYRDDNGTEYKRVIICVEWTNTNASCMFTARLSHHLEEAVFKLDRWDQPIVTKIDEYGNATEHAHWVANPFSKKQFRQTELIFGSRHNEEIWQTYLAEGESADDTDEEQEQKQFPPMPQLKRCNAVTPEERIEDNTGGLSLNIPKPYEEEEDDYEPPEKNEAALRELFNFHESANNITPAYLTNKELAQLSKGTYKCYGDLNPDFKI